MGAPFEGGQGPEGGCTAIDGLAWRNSNPRLSVHRLYIYLPTKQLTSSHFVPLFFHYFILLSFSLPHFPSLYRLTSYLIVFNVSARLLTCFQRPGLSVIMLKLTSTPPEISLRHTAITNRHE